MPAWTGGVYLTGILLVFAYVAVGPSLQRALPAKLALGWAPLLHALRSDAARTVLFTLGYGALVGCYLWCLRHVQFERISFRSLFGWAFCFAVVLLAMPPHFSDDIVGYAQYGRVLSHYGVSPYTHTLTEFHDPWAVYRQYWAKMPSPYGPVMTVLLAGAAAIGGNSLVLTVAVLKLLMAASYLVSGWFLWRALQTLRPQAASQGLFFFLWNPLVLLELVGQAHNDGVMIALMLAGLCLLVRQEPVAANLALLLSALTKFTSGVVMPLYWGLLIRRRAWKPLLMAAVLGSPLVLASWWFFYREPGSFNGLRAVSALAWNSPVWLSRTLMERALSQSPEAAQRLIQMPLVALFLVFLGWRMAKVTSEIALLRETAWVSITFLLLINPQGNTWYLTMLVPLAVLTTDRAARWIVLVLTAWPLAAYFRPWLYHAPMWANVLRTLLLYALLAGGVYLALRRTARLGSGAAEAAGRAASSQ